VTTQITFRPGLEGLMAALSVAERLTANAPVPPHGVTISSDHFGYAPDTDFKRPTGVLLFFAASVDQVRAFAEALHVAVAEREHPGEKTYTYAEGVLDGVPFRAWTLTDAEAPAVAA
jgi:hypothetical protein